MAGFRILNLDINSSKEEFMNLINNQINHSILQKDIALEINIGYYKLIISFSNIEIGKFHLFAVYPIKNYNFSWYNYTIYHGGNIFTPNSIKLFIDNDILFQIINDLIKLSKFDFLS